MANPNIKFFRCNPWPSTITPQEGYVWFNTTDRTISLYKNGAWEKYTGKINNVTYEDGVLTIIPHEGESIPINLGNVANIEGLSSRLGTIETTVNNTLAPAVATLVGADTVSGSVSNKIKTAVEALDATVTGEGTFVDVTVTQTDGKITGVSVAESNIASTSALNTVDQKVDGEITRATNKENELAGAIDTQKGRIDTLIGDGDGSVKKIAYNVLAEELLAGPDGAVDNFKTLQELAAWLEQHPEDAATMNSNISTNTTNIATNTADITTIKGNIETINTTIEENEFTVASALTDLDTRLTSLASNTISSVSGENYIEVTTTDGAVTVKATTGAVANSDNALALASDVKAYVDNA